MSKTYYSVLTTYGAQLFAQAMANRQQVRITQFAVGDGNGRAVQPDSSRTNLVRQVHRANISAISPDPRNNKQVIFELTIPENVGGFWIREMGIFDANNRLVAYANCPDTYKPQLSEGSGKIQVMRMILLVSSNNAVTLTVDDSVIFATRGQLTPKTITANSANGVDDTGHTHAIDHASTGQKGIVQLTNDTGLDSEALALTAKAGKKLAQEIAQNRQKTVDLANQKVNKTDVSDAVNSTSQTTVASSRAVNTAFDKAVEANNNANGRVAKSGDTMTGELISTYGSAAGAFDVQHQRTAPFFVQAGNARGENRYFPYIKGRVGNGQSWESSFSVGYMTAGGWNQWGEGAIVLNEDNGWHKYWRFLHNGNFRSAGDVLTSSGHSLDSCQEQLTGFINGNNYIKRIGNNHNIQLRWEGENLALKVDVTELGGLHYGDKSYVDATIKNSDYGGINLRRRGRDGNWDSRIEALVDKRWKFWVQNSHEIYLPARSGTVALDGEVLHKAGDTVTGELISTYGAAAGAFDVQQQRTAPFFVQAGNARGENRYFPYLKGRVGNGQGWESSFSMGYMTAGGWNQWGEGVIVLNEDNGWHKYWRFLHNGDFHSAGNVISSDGKSLNNAVMRSDFTQLFTPNGWAKLPNGLILQWGTKDFEQSEERQDYFSFPITFPNACLNCSLTRKTANHDASGDGGALLISASASGCNVSLQSFSNKGQTTRGYTWIAIGF